MPSAATTVALNEPNRAVAASTAVAIAIPLVMALVVLPIASRRVSTTAPSPVTSPDISAMPWALSETGPNVSIDTMTPTVVSRPVPASATANNAIVALPVPSRNAAYTAPPISSAEYTADSRPTEMPDRITVAAPVAELSPISLTGLRLVSVKYPVSNWMALASTSPTITAPMASSRGLPPWIRIEWAVRPVTPLRSLNLAGR